MAGMQWKLSSPVNPGEDAAISVTADMVTAGVVATESVTAEVVSLSSFTAVRMVEGPETFLIGTRF